MMRGEFFLLLFSFYEIPSGFEHEFAGKDFIPTKYYILFLHNSQSLIMLEAIDLYLTFLFFMPASGFEPLTY